MERDDRGFTLIELMVVVLIIAVLIAIAVPSMAGARQSAADRATQANIRSAFAATRIYYDDHLRYTTSATEMTAVEPTLAWTATALDASAPPRSVSVSVFDNPTIENSVVLTGRTRSGRCFYLRDVLDGAEAGTYYGRDVSGGASCPVPGVGIALTAIAAPAW